MDYVITAIIAFIGGGICVFVALDKQRRRNRQEAEKLLDREDRLQLTLRECGEKQREINASIERLRKDHAQFDARIISYKELEDENATLKRDLRNIEIERRKLELDQKQIQERQLALDERINDLGSRYLKENVKWISDSLTPNNFTACKNRLLTVIERCRSIDYEVPVKEEDELLQSLRKEFEMVVRVAFEKEEQARIRAQIREEQKREKEIQRQLEMIEREREAIEAALAIALERAMGEYSEEVERLRAKLIDAEERSKRAISQAQLTKSGHVYVISNIGSFGDDIIKIGMTRRLEPDMRIRELGSASVPFPFDVHMMISCDDAPTLENTLHRALHSLRINKANPRKEFFKVNLDRIRELVEEHHGEVRYVADAEALEYRQSLEMSEDDQEFIEHVYEDLEADGSGSYDV